MISVANYLDLIVVPLARLQRRATRIDLLTSAPSYRDRVHGSRPVHIGLIGLGHFVDLDLEAGIDREPGRVTRDARIVEADGGRLSRIARPASVRTSSSREWRMTMLWLGYMADSSGSFLDCVNCHTRSA